MMLSESALLMPVIVRGEISHYIHRVPSGKRLHSYGKSPFLMGKSTISMAIFHSFLYVYQRVILVRSLFHLIICSITICAGVSH